MDFHGFFRDKLLECSPAKVAEKDPRFTSCCRWGSGTQRVNPQRVWPWSNNTRLSSIFMIITILLSRSTATTTTATNQQSTIIIIIIIIINDNMNIIVDFWKPDEHCCDVTTMLHLWHLQCVQSDLEMACHRSWKAAPAVIGSFHPMAEFSRLNPCLEMSLNVWSKCSSL